MDPIFTLTPYLFQISFNIIHPLAHGSPKWSRPFRSDDVAEQIFLLLILNIKFVAVHTPICYNFLSGQLHSPALPPPKEEPLINVG